MSSPWEAAVIVLWVVVLFVGLLVLGVIRRISIELGSAKGSAEVGLDDLVRGLPVGHGAPHVLARRSGTGAEVPVVELGRWNVVTLLSEDCAHCHALVEDLKQSPIQIDSARVVLVIEATQPARDLVADLHLPVLFQESDTVSRAFDTTASPFTFVFDPTGTVRARGHPNNVAALQELLKIADADLSQPPANLAKHSSAPSPAEKVSP